MKWIIAFAIAGIVFPALDALWLRSTVDRLYRPVIGNLLADKFRVGPALAFYAFYVSGIIYFAAGHGIAENDVSAAALNGAILGAVCYATFDFTNQAVMKSWSTRISVIDIMWGTFATAVTAAIATWAALNLF